MIEILTFNSKKVYKKYMENLNIDTRILMNHMYCHYMDKMDDPLQKLMFHDWWNCESVFTEQYQSEIGLTVEQYENVRGWIADATSKGLG